MKWWLCIVVCIVMLGTLDFLTGHELQFFVFYFIPIGLAAWRLGLIPSIIAAIGSALVWALADILAGHVYSSHMFAIWNTLIRLTAFLSIGWAVSMIRQLLDREHRLSEELRDSLAKIRVMEGLLPICAGCKKIRTEQQEWQPLESYFNAHSSVKFTHGLCPQCVEKYMREAGLRKDQGQETGS